MGSRLDSDDAAVVPDAKHFELSITERGSMGEPEYWAQLRQCLESDIVLLSRAMQARSDEELSAITEGGLAIKFHNIRYVRQRNVRCWQQIATSLKGWV
jgi:hypothetical protein